MIEFTQQFVKIRRCTPEDAVVLEKLTASDGHASVLPTHVVEKGPQIVGSLSIGVLPVVLVWMDTERTKARDSACVMNFFENNLADKGAPFMLLPCAENSPFRPFLDKVGYTNMGQFSLFVKKL